MQLRCWQCAHTDTHTPQVCNIKSHMRINVDFCSWNISLFFMSSILSVSLEFKVSAHIKSSQQTQKESDEQQKTRFLMFIAIANHCTFFQVCRNTALTCPYVHGKSCWWLWSLLLSIPAVKWSLPNTVSLLEMGDFDLPERPVTLSMVHEWRLY